MTLPIYVINFLQFEVSPQIQEIIKLVCVAGFPAIVTYFATRKVTTSTVTKTLSEIAKNNQDMSLSDNKNKDYWMGRFEKGLEEAIKLEEENADLRIFKKHTLRLLKKLRRLVNFKGNETLLEELTDLETEAET